MLTPGLMPPMVPGNWSPPDSPQGPGGVIFCPRHARRTPYQTCSVLHRRTELVLARQGCVRPSSSQLRPAKACRCGVRGSRLDESRRALLYRCPERGPELDVARVLDSASDRDEAKRYLGDLPAATVPDRAGSAVRRVRPRASCRTREGHRPCGSGSTSYAWRATAGSTWRSCSVGTKISRSAGRWLKMACAFPHGPNATSSRGIDRTDWFRMSRDFYDACLDPRDYRPGR